MFDTLEIFINKNIFGKQTADGKNMENVGKNPVAKGLTFERHCDTDVSN